MKSLTLIFVVLCLICLSTGVLGAVETINYPAPNDIIPETARIRLDVSSDAADEGCVFSYDNVKNVSVSCNGVSLVNLPNADGTYLLRVTNGSGSCVSQYVTVSKPSGAVVLFIYILSYFVIFGIGLALFWVLIRLVLLKCGLIYVAISLCLYFALIFDYQLALDYVNIPFLMSWLNLFQDIGLWTAVFIPLVLWLVCGLARTFKKGKKGNLGTEMVSWSG